MNGSYDMGTEQEVSAQLKQNLGRVNERVLNACIKTGRAPQEVMVLPITKYADARMTGLLHQLGVVAMGESRPQIIWEKANALPEVAWHLVGHLQRNKIARTLPLVKLIHSVDSQRLLLALEEEAKKLNQVQDVLLELHLTGEENKSGFAATEWPKLPEYAGTLKHVRVLGLMGMAALDATSNQARTTFASLRKLRDEWQPQFAAPHQLHHLSMGMTHDFEEAIAEGSTILRIGSAFFEGIA